MIGSNSTTKTIIVPNHKDVKHSYEVLVQYDKHKRICDILLPIQVIKPDYPEGEITPIMKTAFKEAMEKYKQAEAIRSSIRSELLNEFRGRQIDGTGVVLHLANLLMLMLN